MPEPTIVEKLEADAKAATEKVSALQAELDAARADIEAKSAEISTLSASLANAEKNAEDMSKALDEKSSALEKALADQAAAETLAQEAETRAKLAEGALARDPEALRRMKLAGANSPLPGTAHGTGSGDPQSWAEAVEACGGGDKGYIAARKQYPALFESNLKKDPNQRKN